jgi:N-acetylmuramoyl-L-alanine amidase
MHHRLEMTNFIKKTVCGTVRRPVALILLIQLAFAWPAWAVTPKQQYYRAEHAYAAFKHKPSYQKYRDKWLACINKFEAVYRLDPKGAWAAAGLYQAGLLYLKLHRRSFLDTDRQKAVDVFRDIIRRFPESRYTPKARSQLARLGKPALPPKSAAAAALLKKAYHTYDRLRASARRQKYRDQWEKCISGFRRAYRTDRTGPSAAESLFMVATLYQGLAGASHRQSDRDTARAYYRRVQRRFPGSPFAEKAESALGDHITSGNLISQGKNDSLADVIARNESESKAGNPKDKTQRGGLANVQGLRFWSNPDYTRIVVDASQETSFTHRLLKKNPSMKKPQRLYIDLHKSRLSEKVKKFVPINDELLTDARAGQYSADSVRVVVDIKSFKDYKIFSLKNPFRIVLDVWGENSDGKAGGSAASAMKRSSGKLPPGAIARQLALGVSRIVIDAGHGGKDYGASGCIKGVYEKNITLQIAKRLARKVERELHCDVILTRTTDRYLTLEERTAIANTQNADLFVSIHANASRDRSAHGLATYFLNLATDNDAIRVAARENATSTKNISDLESILNDLMQNAKINESSRLAAMVQRQTYLRLEHHYSHIRSNGVKQAPFYVLLGAQMPAILVETSFISNPRECRRLTSARYQDQLCDGIVSGIRKYIQATSPTAYFHPPAKQDGKG